MSEEAAVPVELFYSLFEQTLADIALEKWRVYYDALPDEAVLEIETHLKGFIEHGYGFPGA